MYPKAFGLQPEHQRFGFSWKHPLQYLGVCSALRVGTFFFFFIMVKIRIDCFSCGLDIQGNPPLYPSGVKLKNLNLRNVQKK